MVFWQQSCIQVPIRTKNCEGVLKISEILAVMQSWVSHFVKTVFISGNPNGQLSKAELGLLLAGPLLLHRLPAAPTALRAPWASGSGRTRSLSSARKARNDCRQTGCQVLKCKDPPLWCLWLLQGTKARPPQSGEAEEFQCGLLGPWCTLEGFLIAVIFPLRANVIPSVPQ